MKTRNFVENEASNLNLIHESIMSLARQICERTRQSIEKQCDDIIRTGVIFSDLQERKASLQTEILRLEEIQKHEFEKLKGLQYKVRRIRRQRGNLLLKAQQLEEIPEEIRDRFEELESQLAEAEFEVKEYIHEITCHGRMCSARAGTTILALKEQLAQLNACQTQRIFNMEANKEKFVSIYNNPDEPYEIAKTMEYTMAKLANGRMKDAGVYNKEEYFCESVFQMTPDDFEFHPFEHIQNGVCDMDKLDPNAVRKCFYVVVAGKTMKFARMPLDRLFKQMDMFVSQSELDDTPLESLLS